MFNNPGGKLKTYAKVLFWIGAITAIISGLSVGAMVGNIFDSAFAAILVGLIIIAIGILLAWLSVIAVYAFGVLVENSDELVRISGGKPSGQKKAAKVQAPTKEQLRQEMRPAHDEPKLCPSCGAELNAGARFCKSCGAKLD